MFCIKTYYLVSTLTLICAVVFVSVNSSEDNGKDVKPEVSTLKVEEELSLDLKKIEKEIIKGSGGRLPEDASIDGKVKVDLKKVEEVEGTEETIKEYVKETITVIIKEPVTEAAEETDKEEKEVEKEIEAVEPSEVSKESASEEGIEAPTSASPMLVKETTVEKEESPEDTFAVWNSKGKICVLARFNATFSIAYSSQGGEEKATFHVPKTGGNAKGKCESTSRSPLLQVSWGKNVLTMMFNKSDEENWVLTSVELTYDTSDALFDRATNAGKKTARSKALNLFETPVGKSYYCPVEEPVTLYTANKQVVIVRIKDIVLQPYAVEDGKFSPGHRCNKVALDNPDEAPFVQDETVPLAVGCTLALITLCILIGFSVHRAYNAAKVDYNNME